MRDDSTGTPRWYSGQGHSYFPSHQFDLRRKHALQFIDFYMAGIKAQDLRESGLKISIEPY
jgi:hypothetical protein